jgi:3-(3-hydroxy-phenyl)propionate hydroxylase
LRRATLDLARQHEFARRVTNMGRMSTAFTYDASPLTTSGGDALPNMKLRRDGGEGTLRELLPGTEMVVLLGPGCDAPDGVRAYRVGADVAGAAIEATVPPGTALVVRPDQHVAARLERPSPASLRQAIDRAWGKAA